MYGESCAIAEIAEKLGKKDIADKYRQKAAELKKAVQEKMWDKDAQFFKTITADNLNATQEKMADVRELYGYAFWYFNLPDPGYEAGWKELVSTDGFRAPYGPAFAEQRHPKFIISYEGHECQWNGPSWPLSTSIILTAFANLLNNYKQDVVDKRDFFETMKIYADSHRMVLEDGRIVPWIDENLNPYTGDWIARTRLKSWKNGTWDPEKGGAERGKDYNHSTFCDLVITGIAGLRPPPDGKIVVNPLVPEGVWDYFCLDNVLYHGKIITIVYDKFGNKYNKGKGLHVFENGTEVKNAYHLL